MNKSLFPQIAYDCIGEEYEYIYIYIYMQITMLFYSGLFQLQMTESKHKVTHTGRKFIGSVN